MSAFRILIADDHEVVRKGLCALLQAEPGWEVCGEGVGGVESGEVDVGQMTNDEIRMTNQ